MTDPARPRPRRRAAAFFDMDDTVLRIDTGTSWMRFLYRRGELGRLGLARAVWWSALYKLAVLDLESPGDPADRRPSRASPRPR